MSVQDLMGNDLENTESKAASTGLVGIDPMLYQADPLPTAAKLAEDAGARAREKIKSRGSRVRRTVLTTYLVLNFLLLAVIAAGAYYLYLEYNKPGKRVVTYKNCEFTDENQHFTLTGRREYSYLQKSLFGLDIRHADNVTETTQLDVQGTAMTVVGLTADKWWGVYIGTGEKGIQILKDAHTYIVTSDKKAVVINYEQFCQ
jgi:hypothetical protein